MNPRTATPGDCIILSFDKPELADILRASKPPKGVKVSKPAYRIECAAPGEIFTQLRCIRNIKAFKDIADLIVEKKQIGQDVLKVFDGSF